jgi:putative transcriptional regulator
MSAAGDKVLGSIRKARAILRGESAGELVVHVPPEFDVKALRRKLDMSQSRFAKSFGFGLAAVQSWEQGRRSLPLAERRGYTAGCATAGVFFLLRRHVRGSMRG